MELSSLVGFVQNSLLLVGFLIVTVLLLLFFFQNKLLYMPVLSGQPKSPRDNPPGYQTPADRGIPYEDITIQTKDGETLKGWISLQPDSVNSKTVVYFHENAGNIGTRVFYMEYFYRMVKANIILVAYRGYSDSTGIPTEQGLMIDGEAILEHTLSRKDIDTNNVFVIGRSLGGAVVAHVMTHQISQQVRGVILENTFTSISDMVDVVFPKLKWFKKLIQKNFWGTSDRVAQIRQPILFIISMKDEIVPAQQMIELVSKARSARFVEKFVMPEGNHNGNWAQDTRGYFGSIKKFMDEA